MASVNKKPKDHRIDDETRLAGGFGQFAAQQGAEQLLRRAVLANLLWEDMYYETGEASAENIKRLIAQVDPEIVASIAVEARNDQKLRHVPLLIAREMARLDTHKKLVGKLLPQIIRRPDELTEFLAIYWKDGRQSISKQVKKGLAKAIKSFNEYQLAKYNRDEAIRERDVMFMVHPKPETQEQEALFTKLAENQLETPDTWEVALSAGADKKETWTRLIQEGKIGALAFLRNLRNMERAHVERAVIREGFEHVNARWLLPLNYIAAAKAAPEWEKEIQALMLRGLAQAPKLPGRTIFVVDVSGSMSSSVSSKSDFSRIDAAGALAILAAEMCEEFAIYATAGSDARRMHKTMKLPARHGFALSDAIRQAAKELGGGGIFTRQCLEYIREQETETPDRIMVFSDSQDCDVPSRSIPAPFGKYNYIVDVSSHARGINYEGIWTAEITGWSEHFLSYVAALEGIAITQGEDQG